MCPTSSRSKCLRDGTIERSASSPQHSSYLLILSKRLLFRNLHFLKVRPFHLCVVFQPQVHQHFAAFTPNSIPKTRRRYAATKHCYSSTSRTQRTETLERQQRKRQWKTNHNPTYSAERHSQRASVRWPTDTISCRSPSICACLSTLRDLQCDLRAAAYYFETQESQSQPRTEATSTSKAATISLNSSGHRHTHARRHSQRNLRVCHLH